MNRILLVFCVFGLTLNAQTPGYYNGTEGKTGDDLKATLHEIINDHIDFSYSDCKYILEYVQEDPDNSDNLISFYTGASVSKGSSSWGTGGDFLNREHVWAKSHGDFLDIRPMDGDAHNLHAADASVNLTRNNYDFDYVTDGTYIEEADAYYNGSTSAYEPSDRDKGEVARTILYMAVRYEGTNGEMDLTVVDALNTSYEAEHGKLSSLLEWNRMFPPTDFERRRNDRVEQSQGNRNPFIDNPAWADMIWSDDEAAPEYIYDVNLQTTNPVAESLVVINFKTSDNTTAKFSWGTSYAAISNEVELIASPSLPGSYSAEFTPIGVVGNELVYCRMIAVGSETSDTAYTNFYIAPEEQLITISAVQGTGETSPLANQTVTVGGIVTANFDNFFTLQSGNGPQNAVTVYSNWRGEIGDSLVVKGDAYEYYGLTEISPVTMVYNFGPSNAIVPDTISFTDISEFYESNLVLFENVLFVDGGGQFSQDKGDYVISDGINSATVHVRFDSRLAGQLIPNGALNITGVITYDYGEYKIIINSLSEIVSVEDNTPPQLLTVELEDRSDNYVWLNVSFNEIVDEDDVTEKDNFSVTGGVTIKKNYYYDINPNQVKILIENIGLGDYTLSASNIADAFGNILDTADVSFTSTIDKTTALSNTQASQLVSIYPIPVNSGVLTVTAEENIESVSVYSVSGKILISDININDTEKEMNLSSLESGAYLLQVELADKMVNRKFSIE